MLREKNGEDVYYAIRSIQTFIEMSVDKEYLKLYPLLGLFGKPKDYNRFLCNANAILRFDAREELKQIRCHTLIIGGEEDKTVGPDGSKELHAAIAGSELFMYPGLGHAAFEEAPDFNTRVFEYINRNNKNAFEKRR